MIDNISSWNFAGIQESSIDKIVPTTEEEFTHFEEILKAKITFFEVCLFWVTQNVNVYEAETNSKNRELSYLQICFFFLQINYSLKNNYFSVSVECLVLKKVQSSSRRVYFFNKKLYSKS